jgi:membrane protein insertase Oxa1/YidC/SpoIIIJ
VVSVLLLVLLFMNYSLKVVKLVLHLLVTNYVVDLMMCVILVLCMIYPVYSAYFGGSPTGEAAKTGSTKKIKLL